jgi:hypothetical protein
MCTEQSVSGGLPTASFIEIFVLLFTTKFSQQFIYWFPNIFIFNKFFHASCNAASDKTQFVVIKVFNVLFIIFSSDFKMRVIFGIIHHGGGGGGGK